MIESFSVTLFFSINSKLEFGPPNFDLNHQRISSCANSIKLPNNKYSNIHSSLFYTTQKKSDNNTSNYSNFNKCAIL